ncbi:DUF3313 family protein [Aurantivibrio infirmus]
MMFEIQKRFSFTVAISFFLATLLSNTLFAQVAPNTDELKTTYLKPNINLRQYDQFIIRPLDLSDTRIVPPAWVDNPDPRQWVLSESNREFLKVAFRAAMRVGLEEGGKFNVVRNATNGTLQLEIKIVSLSPYAPRDKNLTTKGYGELSFEAQLRDAQTGDLLAMYEGVQQVGDQYQENTEFNQANSFAEQFRQWGRNVSTRLEAAQKQ